MRVALGVVLPGANLLTVLPPYVGHIEVAAAVERQSVGTVQPGEGGAGRGAPRANLLTVLLPWLAT